MNRVALAALLLFALASSASAQLHGAWTAEHDGDRLQLSISYSGSNHMSQGHSLTDFAGLTPAQMDAATQTPVRFQVQHEAGTAVFEGVFKRGDGAGTFDFTPNRSYLDAVRSRGISVDRITRHADSIDEQLLAMALMDVATKYIDAMIAEGYRVSLDRYLAMRIFRVTPELVRELRSLGFDNLGADDLVAAQIHKVTPRYVREMRAAGYNLTMSQLLASRIHRVTPEFIDELRDAGYANVPFDKLLAMRIHGIDAAFIARMNAASSKK